MNPGTEAPRLQTFDDRLALGGKVFLDGICHRKLAEPPQTHGHQTMLRRFYYRKAVTGWSKFG
jgi:hypothetical protein